jgi:hypothetical protein
LPEETSPEAPEVYADRDDDEEIFRRLRNPVIAWSAIAECIATADPPGSVNLPLWCAEYLEGVAVGILRLAAGHDYDPRATSRAKGAVKAGSSETWGHLTPDDAMRMVPRALGLRRDGWSAFQAWRTFLERQLDFEVVHDLRTRHGLSAAETERRLAERRGLSDERAARRRLADARRAVGLKRDET